MQVIEGFLDLTSGEVPPRWSVRVAVSNVVSRDSVNWCQSLLLQRWICMQDSIDGLSSLTGSAVFIGIGAISNMAQVCVDCGIIQDFHIDV